MGMVDVGDPARAGVTRTKKTMEINHLPGWMTASHDSALTDMKNDRKSIRTAPAGCRIAVEDRRLSTLKLTSDGPPWSVSVGYWRPHAPGLRRGDFVQPLIKTQDASGWRRDARSPADPTAGRVRGRMFWEFLHDPTQQRVRVITPFQ